MFDFNKPNIEITDISDDKKYGRFVVEPLERGYGTTLGNSLRRIMLSSLPGSAISQVKIDGVLHEFSSIPGVKEDVTEIIMNLKSLAIKNTSESDEPKTAYIEFEGEGVVTAADIQVDQDIEIMNPETVIATLNGGADSKLYMEMTITKGRGYVSADKNKSDDLPIGVIPIDSVYTPVERVNMTVQNTRVGQVTDYDKLTLDVWTKGTLLPDEAVSLAAKVLSEHLKLFIDLSEVAQAAEVMIEKEDDEKEMSLDMNAYNGAILELLRAETAEQRAEARKLWNVDDPEANIVMDKIEKMCTEMAELKTFKETELEKQKDFEVDKILASVKDDLKMEDYEELEAKKKDVTFESLEQFKLEAKSFAYDHRIKKQAKKDDGVIRMGYDFSKYNNDTSDENVWDRINKK